ncbi:MAG: hypothetical protein RMX96_29255 [Nostoc sp. ChiSLP02]|nr:hypothetical protein [Nostoc sp. DedSLP05]MDZ8100264.1 hypothetical protein [Nostoc sp. DedSLP01]MDZ8188929.1 hypothetical protein [Nostoc sp. ChiSLP02]
MKFWQKIALQKLFRWSSPILRWVVVFVMVCSLSSCGDKAGSQEISIGNQEKAGGISQVSKEFSEVPPPPVIQELRPILEVYQPQVTIVTPKFDEVFSDNKVTARFQVKDLPIFKEPQLQLGPHLHVILDNQPYIPVYDLNQPLVLPDLSPGTHTLRVFASRPWHESFKNEGAYTQTTFHVFTTTDDNNPDPNLPLLTYSRPQSSYGAEPILLDFYLTNAPLHLAASENAKNEFSDWRIRCTINGESFIFDRWQSIYLKGWKPGKNWVKLEFLDNQGNPLKNTFNTTVRLINYEPKGKDTLSRITRGELTADEVRSIVDPTYKFTPAPTVEKTPEVEPKEKKQPIPEIQIPEESKTQPTKPEEPKLEPPTAAPSPSLSPTPPNIIESPAPEPQPTVTPTPKSTPLPEKVTPEPAKRGFGGFFNRRGAKTPTPETTVTPSPSSPPTLPEIIESPAPEKVTPSPEPQPTVTPPVVTQPEPQPTVTPTPEVTPANPSAATQPEPQPTLTPIPESTPLPEKVAPEPAKSRFGGFGRFFKRRTPDTPTPKVIVAPSPSSLPTLPEIIAPPAPETVTPSPEPQPEVTPTAESTSGTAE